MNNDNFKIITIVGDSLSMVRPDCGMALKDLFPYKLQIKLGKDYYVIVRNRRANDTETQCMQQHFNDDILYNDSRYLVIHLGIVDCAPRLISRKEYLVFRLLGINYEDNFYIRFKSKHRRFFTKHFPLQRVSKERFKSNFLKLIDLVETQTAIKKVFIINIADTNETNKLRSFNLGENIQEYNEILENIVKGSKGLSVLIDIYNESKKDKEILLEDGMHLSLKGHDFLANALNKYIIESEKEIFAKNA